MIFCHSCNSLLTLAYGKYHKKPVKDLSHIEEEKEFVRFVSTQLKAEKVEPQCISIFCP